ncbi:MAG: hypothetical protein ACI90V_007851 [Bacillariaceae sp.]|jgi:hypothetical protein
MSSISPPPPPPLKVKKNHDSSWIKTNNNKNNSNSTKNNNKSTKCMMEAFEASIRCSTRDAKSQISDKDRTNCIHVGKLLYAIEEMKKAMINHGMTRTVNDITYHTDKVLILYNATPFETRDYLLSGLMSMSFIPESSSGSSSGSGAGDSNSSNSATTRTASIKKESISSSLRSSSSAASLSNLINNKTMSDIAATLHGDDFDNLMNQKEEEEQHQQQQSSSSPHKSSSLKPKSAASAARQESVVSTTIGTITDEKTQIKKKKEQDNESLKRESKSSSSNSLGSLVAGREAASSSSSPPPPTQPKITAADIEQGKESMFWLCYYIRYLYDVHRLVLKCGHDPVDASTMAFMRHLFPHFGASNNHYYNTNAGGGKNVFYDDDDKYFLNVIADYQIEHFIKNVNNINNNPSLPIVDKQTKNELNMLLGVWEVLLYLWTPAFTEVALKGELTTNLTSGR